MPETVTIERPTKLEEAAERAAYARRVFADQLAPGAGEDRLSVLIASADAQADLWRARALLLRALQDDPDWRTALLAAGVAVVVPDPDEGACLGGPELWEAVDRKEGAAILARAADRVRAAGGPAIANPANLLAHFAPILARRAPPIT